MREASIFMLVIRSPFSDDVVSGVMHHLRNSSSYLRTQAAVTANSARLAEQLEAKSQQKSQEARVLWDIWNAISTVLREVGSIDAPLRSALQQQMDPVAGAAAALDASASDSAREAAEIRASAAAEFDRIAGFVLEYNAVICDIVAEGKQCGGGGGKKNHQKGGGGGGKGGGGGGKGGGGGGGSSRGVSGGKGGSGRSKGGGDGDGGGGGDGGCGGGGGDGGSGGGGGDGGSGGSISDTDDFPEDLEDVTHALDIDWGDAANIFIALTSNYFTSYINSFIDNSTSNTVLLLKEYGFNLDGRDYPDLIRKLWTKCRIPRKGEADKTNGDQDYEWVFNTDKSKNTVLAPFVSANGVKALFDTGTIILEGLVENILTVPGHIEEINDNDKRFCFCAFYCLRFLQRNCITGQEFKGNLASFANKIYAHVLKSETPSFSECFNAQGFSAYYKRGDVYFSCLFIYSF